MLQYRYLQRLKNETEHNKTYITRAHVSLWNRAVWPDVLLHRTQYLFMRAANSLISQRGCAS